ncbi:heat shock factor-binding protein 1-like [Marmota monax]|uniref:heat shock factor-binding protein 1-like n=1 Tax=Marmota monax TaxID=9995 RepID=UPI001EB009E2|nr:heat shock factor-binding protein 1-like [Marmota monax]
MNGEAIRVGIVQNAMPREWDNAQSFGKEIGTINFHTQPDKCEDNKQKYKCKNLENKHYLAAKLGTGETAKTDPKTVQDLTSVVQTLLQQMQDKFQTMSDQIIGRIDDMSSRIDDLEKNIADLMTQAEVEELEGENKIPATQKS